MNPEKISEFLLKIIKLTGSDDILWKSITPDRTTLANEDIVLDKIYKANIGGKEFQLYKFKRKDYQDVDVFDWVQGIRLELLDYFGNVEYEIESDYSLENLYTIVREKCSGISRIIDDILGKDLEIVKASYGIGKNWFDVTEQLKSKVAFNKLSIVASNDIAGDPIHGHAKVLRVKYQFAGEAKDKEIKEGDTLELP